MAEQDGNGPFEVKVALWEVDYEGDIDRAGEAEGNERTVEGFYDEPTKIDCVNALLCDLRGRKSTWELAYIDEITTVEGNNE